LIHGAWTAVRADVDRDGDLDLIVASPTDAVKLFRNDVPRRGNWLEFRLSGSPANGVPMDAYGTTVTVFAGGQMLTRDLQGGGSGATASQNSNELHFGTGPATLADSVFVRYPNGETMVYRNVPTNASYAVAYRSELVRTSGVDDRTAGLPGVLSLAQPAFETDAFSVAITAPAAGTHLVIEVSDALGNCLGRAETTAPTGSRVRVPVAGPVASGGYVIRAAAGGRTATVKLVVVR
jgi:hypothetical protein